VLDIGCGTGACAAALLSFDRVAYVGIDVERSYIDYARRRHAQGEFLCADATREQFSGRLFDVVLMFSILHHLSDDESARLVESIPRVLAPDGVVLSAEPLFPERQRYRGAARMGALLSEALLNMDRGEHIRDQPGYWRLWEGFHRRADYTFWHSPHNFCGLVLTASP
jgi:SAM-dependent methyltransferase